MGDCKETHFNETKLLGGPRKVGSNLKKKKKKKKSRLDVKVVFDTLLKTAISNFNA
jgi:hypothetical protein